MDKEMQKKKKEIMSTLFYEGIDYIEFVFENCERIRIPREYVGEFLIANIGKEIARMGANYIGRYNCVHKFFMSIHEDADKPCNQYVSLFSSDENLFDRIEFNDITGVNIVYLWGEREEFLVAYKEKDEDVLGSPNLNQKTVRKFGDLYLSICDVDDEDFSFPKTKKERDWIWSCYKIKPYKKEEDVE